ncbi:MAG: hypothetical protein ACLSE4_02225 [Clostridium sp.]
MLISAKEYAPKRVKLLEESILETAGGNGTAAKDYVKGCSERVSGLNS